MRAYLTLTRRELGAFFVSFTGYVIIAAAGLVMGESFTIMLRQLQGEPTLVPVTQLFYSTYYFWLILLLACPLITMRLFALEKFSGTFETLMTAPVSDLQVVLAKFTAAMVFYVLLLLPSAACILVLRHFVANQDVFESGLLGSTFLGVVLLGGLFMSLGCFASALTRNQIVAAMISFTIGFTFLLLSLLPDYVQLSPGWPAAVLSQFALHAHMDDFASGFVDTRHVVFYLTVTWLFLFLTLRVVESRRWK
jgi:ABC-2 type transport system permease protein